MSFIKIYLYCLIGNEEVVYLVGIENGINSNNINFSYVFIICGR